MLCRFHEFRSFNHSDDLLPKKPTKIKWRKSQANLPDLQAIGSIVGIGGMAGAIGVMLISKIVGYILQPNKQLCSDLFIGGSTYFMALVIVHLLVPTLGLTSLKTHRPVHFDD
jgi:nitrate/nitrite transporter NarK